MTKGPQIRGLAIQTVYLVNLFRALQKLNNAPYLPEISTANMGTWSRPLFATVSTGAPEDYVIDTSLMTHETIAQWRHAAFLGYDTSKTRWTLNEFMTTECDSHKIIDHMDRTQVVRWEALFRQLYTAYPALNKVAFHFFCSDGAFPYYLTMDRGDDEKLYLCQGHSESYVYFKPQKQRGFFGWFTRSEEEGAAEFMSEWYRRAYLAGGLDMRCISLDSSRMMWW